MQKSEREKAIYDFTKAIQLKPKFGEAYLSRGSAYAKSGKYDSAIADYNKALAIYPDSGDIYYNRAVSYYGKREYDKAWEDVNKAHSLGCEVHPIFIKNLKKASGKE